MSISLENNPLKSNINISQNCCCNSFLFFFDISVQATGGLIGFTILRMNYFFLPIPLISEHAIYFLNKIMVFSQPRNMSFPIFIIKEDM